MTRHGFRPGGGHGRSQSPRRDDDVVHQAQDGDEIWDEVEGLRVVEHRNGQPPPDRPGQRGIPGQVPEQPQHVGDDPGHPAVDSAVGPGPGDRHQEQSPSEQGDRDGRDDDGKQHSVPPRVFRPTQAAWENDSEWATRTA